MIRALIVDDEPLARERLRTLLQAEPGVEVVGECGSGPEAVRSIEDETPDLVFLDVQMPEMDGFEVLEMLGPELVPAIVFVTAYDAYALRAFEVHALDYLLKPFDGERFRHALEHARAVLGGSRRSDRQRLMGLLEDLASRRPHLERLVVKAGGRVFFLRVDEIDWIESAGNYVKLHTADREHLLRHTLKSLEEKLDPRRFVRIHRSHIVNLDRVKELHPWFHGEYVVRLVDGTELRSSRTYGDRLERLFGNEPSGSP